MDLVLSEITSANQITSLNKTHCFYIILANDALQSFYIGLKEVGYLVDLYLLLILLKIYVILCPRI